MKRFIIITTFLCLLFATPLFATTMGTSDGHDLDALWAQAQKQYDLSTHDGILLLESQTVTILPNGNRKTRVHRVVWIGSARGIRQYADLRVPFNSANSELQVIALRTWRNETWWPDEKVISETAVVHTLPYAVALADDYTTMRETMLLHDGLELPCIMETIYDIEIRGVAAFGTCGLFVIPQQDDAVRVELTVKVPDGQTLKFHAGNGAPEPRVDGNTSTWTIGNVGRIGVPRIDNPAAFASYVSWSTWPDWKTLGGKISGSFDTAAVVGEELAGEIKTHIEFEPSPAAKARAVVAFVTETTRSIHYNSRFWGLSARPATKTWETAYGHGLDRAVLAAALFRTAGLNAEPVFRSTGFGGIDLDIPGLSRFGPIAVRVSGANGLDAYYDPGEGTLTPGVQPLLGFTVWRPATGNPPALYSPADTDAAKNLYDLALTLEPGDEENWTGTVYLHASGLFSPYGEMSGLSGEAKSYLGDVANSALAGATVTGYNPETFDANAVTTGFNIEIKAIEPDENGRTIVPIGIPDGGLSSQLASGLHLYDENRDSPVIFGGPMTQRISLRVKTDGRRVLQMPENTELENSVGRYFVSTREKDGWVTIEAVLMIDIPVIQPEVWGQLRALLLEAADPAGRTVVLK